LKDKIILTLFISPALILVGFFVYGFTGWSFRMSLTNWEFGKVIQYIGLENYYRIFTDSTFHTSLFNSLQLIVLFIGITIPLGLFLAILLDLDVKGKQFFRIIFLIPLSFSFVASATMWTWMFSPSIGAINSLLRVIGLENLTQPWITSENQALICIIITYIWQFSGFATLVYYAGLSSVSTDIREAAKIDGANIWQRYTKVLIPMQKTATMTVLMILLMYSLRVFDLVWLITGGGPGISSEILPTLMYRTAFNRNMFGVGAGMGAIMFILSIIIVIPFFLSLKGSD